MKQSRHVAPRTDTPNPDKMSAVCYFTALNMRALGKTKYPVGMVVPAVSGRPIKCYQEEGQCFKKNLNQIRGVVARALFYYQGETNGSMNKNAYLPELVHLIERVYRQLFVSICSEFLDIFVVQLPHSPNQDKDAWVGVREAQKEIPRVLNQVWSIPTMDLCKDASTNLHPRVGKAAIGRRIAETMNSCEKQPRLIIQQ